MTDTSPRSAVGEARDERKIRGSMGAAEIAFFTIASAGPLLVIAGFAPLAFMIGGVGAVGVQLLAGIALMLFSVGLTRMATRIRNAGAFYAYIGQGLGKPMGGGAAFLALFTYSIIAIGQLGADRRVRGASPSRTSPGSPCRGLWWPSRRWQSSLYSDTCKLV